MNLFRIISQSEVRCVRIRWLIQLSAIVKLGCNHP